MAVTPTRSDRIIALDAARGTALFFSLLSHFGWAYFNTPETLGWEKRLVGIGMVATPTFVVVSGVLLGYLYRSSGDDFARLRLRLIERGLFLMIVAHILITAAFIPRQHVVVMSLSTDAIGAAMIIGPLVIPHLSGRVRVVIGIATYALSWLLTLTWAPSGWGSDFIEEVTVGSLAPRIFHSGTFPILPWLGVYLICSAYGERFAALHRARQLQRVAYELAAAGIVLVGSAVALRLLELTVLNGPSTRALGELLHQVFRTGQKYPPGPGYLIFFGGIGLFALAGCVVWELQRWGRAPLRLAATVGEASLAIFVCHHYAMWFVIYYLSSGSLVFAPFFFVAFIASMTLLAVMWRRAGANRLIGLGLVAFVATRHTGHRATLLPARST